MTNDPLADQTPYELQNSIFTDLFPYWESKFQATQECVEFLHGDRYADDHGAFNKDRRNVQIRGQETDDTIAHVVAKSTETPLNIEARPIDAEEDADLAEARVALLRNRLDDPYIGFHRELYKAKMAAQQGRRAFLWFDWCPDLGQWGKIVWSLQPNGSLMYDPAYHPHHPLCHAIVRTKRIDYRQANTDYGVTFLRPDHQQLERTGNWKSGIPLMRGFSDRIANQCVKDNRVTIRETWIKNDMTEKPNSQQVKRKLILKPDQRYMACESMCGYRSETQGQMRASGATRMALPPTIEPATGLDEQGQPNGGCPTCGGRLNRMDVRELTQAQLAYAKGKRLIVVAPFCPNPEDPNGVLSDGGWPIPAARSFPVLCVFASVNPADETGGPCLVEKMWDGQVASDNLQTLAVQRVFEYRDVRIMPDVGLYNVRGERYEFRDDDENVMFRNMKKTREYGATPVQNLPGIGCDPELPGIFSIINGGLTRYRPQADIEPDYGQANNANVGTVEAQIQQAEVTTSDFIRRTNEEQGMAYGVYDDYLTATMTPEELQRLNIEGVDTLLRLWGDSMPNYDYVVSETPDYTRLDKLKAQILPDLMGIAQQAVAMGLDPALAVQLHAETNNLPRSLVRKFLNMMSAAAEAADEAAAQGIVPPGGPAGGQGAPVMESPAGPSTNGAPPASMEPAAA